LLKKSKVGGPDVREVVLAGLVANAEAQEVT